MPPRSSCEYEVSISTAFKAAVVGNSHRAVAFLHYTLWLLGKENLPERCVSRFYIRVECARINLQKLRSPSLRLFIKFNLYFFPE